MRSTRFRTPNARGGAIDPNPQVNDVAIADWFGHATGLIDDAKTLGQLPLLSTANELSVVDVVLQATVGIHRGATLIAGEDALRYPGDVREAVFAALANESPPILFDPPTEPVPARFSNLAYPAAAIVASTVAVTAHRRKSVKLESTP